jgi:hypothetical protein
MKEINPPFAPVFPPVFADAPANAPVIGRPRPLRTPMLVVLEAYGAPDVVVVVNAPLQAVARRAAIAWARIHHYGPTRRITSLTLNWIRPSETS